MPAILPVQEERKDQAGATEIAQQAIQRLSQAQKLELFIQLCQQGHNVVAALKGSGIVAGYGYNPDVDTELDLEELFYARCRTRIDKSRPDYPYAIVPDEQFDPAKMQPGDLTTSQLYKLVDWLYFVRALPLKAIAASLSLPDKDVAFIKAELSSDFARAIRQQNAEAYIGDLLRIKELLRADIMSRRSKLGPRDGVSAIRMDQFLWELENKFVDRLQEIGLIDKSLGKIDINEEWHVTIEASGSPVNRKLEHVNQEPFLDIEAVETLELAEADSDELIPEKSGDDLADRRSVESIRSKVGNDSRLRPDQLLAAATQNSATIKVGE